MIWGNWRSASQTIIIMTQTYNSCHHIFFVIFFFLNLYLYIFFIFIRIYHFNSINVRHFRCAYSTVWNTHSFTLFFSAQVCMNCFFFFSVWVLWVFVCLFCAHALNNDLHCTNKFQMNDSVCGIFANISSYSMRMYLYCYLCLFIYLFVCHCTVDDRCISPFVESTCKIAMLYNPCIHL